MKTLAGIVLACALVSSAHAGDQQAECFDAELSYDGRWVRLRPACDVEAYFDLHTHQLLRGAAADKAVAGQGFLPLDNVHGDDDFGQWANKTFQANDQDYRWATHLIDGAHGPWVVRYKVQRYGWGERSPIIGGIQIAPLSLFQAFHAWKLRGDPTIPVAVPIVRPMVVGTPQDVSSLFADATPTTKPKNKLKVVAFTYDAAALAQKITGVADLLAHAPLEWLEVRTESGSTGWKLGEPVANGLWARLGVEKGMRIVGIGDAGAYLGLPRLVTDLKAGKATTIKVFKPYEWTLIELVPKT